MKHRHQTDFLFLNIGHFLDHLFMLIFATSAALKLSSEWGMSYAELIPYATPGFVAFGICAIPAGWLADKWDRRSMIVLFFIGIGIASMLTSLATSPIQIGIGLFCIGIFAAIYHPVGLSLVVQGRLKTGMPLAINGVFGNLGVACAALFTGFLIDKVSWQSAFIVPGVVSIIIGIMYLFFIRGGNIEPREKINKDKTKITDTSRKTLLRIFAIVLASTALGGLIFQSTTFALPKIFDERIGDFASSASQIGWYAFIVFSFAAIAQLIVGYLLDKRSLKTIFIAVVSLQAIFFAIMQNLHGIPALLVSIGFMLVVFGQIPINDVLVGRIASSAWRSRAFAIRYIVTFSVMACSVPLISWIHANHGFNTLFLLLSVTAVLILVVVSLLPSNNSMLRHTIS